MNLKPEFALEVFRQMAFISALIGGFAFSFVGVLLSLPEKRRIINWVIAITIAASSGMIICTLGWTMSSFNAYQLVFEKAVLPAFFKPMHQILSLTFIASLLLFLVSCGLSGWIRSRRLGILSSMIALFAIIGALFILSYFIR